MAGEGIFNRAFKWFGKNGSGQRESLTVVIPVFNTHVFLGEAIQSILTQEVAGVEVVVVNDGSHADARAGIEAICAEFPEVRLIHQSNRGPALAREAGIKESRSEFVMFLDADDRLLPGSIEHLLAALKLNTKAVGAYGPRIWLDKAGNLSGILPCEGEGTSGDILPILLRGFSVLSNGSVCMRREYLEKIEFPADIRQGEDWIVWCRLAALGDIVFAGRRPVVGIRKHESNCSAQVFKDPRSRFLMHHAVFEDSKITGRFSRAELKELRTHHLEIITRHLADNYREKKKRLELVKLMLMRQWFRFLWARKERRRRIKVLHIVSEFYAGGAERLLTAILANSHSPDVEHVILSLSDRGERINQIQSDLKIEFRAIDVIDENSGSLNLLKCFWYAFRVRPTVIKTWLPRSNITGGLIGCLLGKPVIWGIHDPLPPALNSSPLVEQQRKLSRYIPSAVVCCSEPVQEMCQSIGYEKQLLKTITNGTDVEKFHFSQSERASLRAELKLPKNATLIGMAAVWHPCKRQVYFLLAAKLFLKYNKNTHFVFCGLGMSENNWALKRYIKRLGLESHVHLLGVRNDMRRFFSAIDINTLVSRYESFGLSVTEAMACEALCVATDVGIMRELLDDVGFVIPNSEDPEVLVAAWKKAIGLPRSERAERVRRGRERIKQQYSIERTANEYNKLFQEVHYKNVVNG